jgi:RNA polymerase sigma-70 factor (ECF subfamily)
MIDISDEELARRAQAGDRPAFGALIDRYWPRVFRWLVGLTRSTQLAEDIAQDTFLKAWKGIAAFAPETSFRAWVFRIAHNGLIDHQRRERPTINVDAWEEQVGPEVVPLNNVVHEETRAMITAACARLPVSVREAFMLRTQEGLSFAEIALALSSTEETVRWRVHKARQHLLKELGAYLSPQGEQDRVSR